MERKIIDYEILTGKGPSELKKLVKRSIETGWEPQGGIAVNGNGYPMQAIVKFEPEKTVEPAN